MKYDLFIKNTKIIDGSGTPAFAGGVAAKEGKLFVFPPNTVVDEENVIDAKGRYT